MVKKMTHFLYPSLVQFCIPIVIFNSFFKLYLSEVSNYWGKKSQPRLHLAGYMQFYSAMLATFTLK